MYVSDCPLKKKKKKNKLGKNPEQGYETKESKEDLRRTPKEFDLFCLTEQRPEKNLMVVYKYQLFINRKV